MAIASAEETTTTQRLSLPEELVLILLNEETGYFYQVPGWDLNCAIIGAILAELSLMERIDTDMDSLQILDTTKTGYAPLDAILEKVSEEPEDYNAQYWIERLIFRAPEIIDQILDRMVKLGILEYHDGEFWTLARTTWRTEVYAGSREGTALEFVKMRVSRLIFSDEIPDPRDTILISLINACDVFRFMLQLDEESEKRIETICRMDLIGRAIASAVQSNFVGPLMQGTALAKPIPVVPLSEVMFNPNTRSGNIPMLFADIANKHGPVFQLRPPFSEPLIFLAGARTNQWVHRKGRLHLRAKDYFSDFEKIYGANGVLPSLDGADHFRLRRSLMAAYSRERLQEQIGPLYRYIREFMADWKVGDSYTATTLCRHMINAQLSPIMLSVESQDLIDDLIDFKERALMTHIIKILPKFLLYTPGMRRKARVIDELLERVQRVHTPAQRAGASRDLADDILSLHQSDPQFLPESNLRFAISAALVASIYLGDGLCFATYAMAAQPEIYDRIKREADALFENGDPDGDDFTLEAIDVTHRFLMECMRLYPIVPMSVRNVMNSCVVEGCELPLGARIHVAQTASHFMEQYFPEPFKFDIDRYKPPRNEHAQPAFAPYGLGTHKCLGNRWMDRQLTINVMMIAHYFTLDIAPEKFKHDIKFTPLPSNKPHKRLKFVIAEKRRELPV